MPLHHLPREGQYESQNQPEKNLSHEIVLLRGLDGVSHIEWHQGDYKDWGQAESIKPIYAGDKKKKCGGGGDEPWRALALASQLLGCGFSFQPKPRGGVRGERGWRLLAAARYFQFAMSFPSSSRAG